MAVSKCKYDAIPRLLDRRINDAARRASELTATSRSETFKAERLILASRKKVASTREQVSASQRALARSRSLRQRP